MDQQEHTLELLSGVFAVARLGADAEIPAWAATGPFASITRTADELSILCLNNSVPPSVKAERGFRCLRVKGTLDFSEVGILASLVNPLAEAKVSVFALSTFDTDYLLVRDSDLALAQQALAAAGHRLVAQEPQGGK